MACKARCWVSGVRSKGFSTFEMSLVMSAYFVGFLVGSRMAPEMIRRVGHVRVFAALASLISAVMILYPTAGRSLCLGGRAHSDRVLFLGRLCDRRKLAEQRRHQREPGQGAVALHDRADGGHRQRAGACCWLADPGGFVLFIIPSVLVSLAFAPILLSISPTPAFDTTKPMSLSEITEDFAAGLCRYVPAGRHLFGAVRHGVGLWRRGGAERGANLDLRGDVLCRRRWCCNIRSAGCRTGWTGAC